MGDGWVDMFLCERQLGLLVHYGQCFAMDTLKKKQQFYVIFNMIAVQLEMVAREKKLNSAI